jgi:hypothetical protein
MASHLFNGAIALLEDTPLSRITVRPGRRPINQEALDNLAKDMGGPRGLMHRIVLNKEGDSEARVLVEGGHRLEAARQRNWVTIPTYVIDLPEIDAKLWEIAENLMRSELDGEQQAIQRAEYARLTAVKRGELSPDESVTKLLSVTKGGGQNGENAGGLRVAADELGINRETLRLAVHVASIPQEVRDEARAAGVTTQAALLKVAAAAPEKRIEVLAGITKAKTEKRAKAKVPKDIVLDSSEYKVGPTLADQVNALHRAVAEPFVNDLGPLFIAFVKAHPGLEADAITSLHSALDGVETMCRKMREPLMDAGDARLAAKQSESVEADATVEVELDRSAPWKSLPAVEASQATPRHSTLNVKDYLAGLLSSGVALPPAPKTTTAPVVETPPAGDERYQRRRARLTEQRTAA